MNATEKAPAGLCGAEFASDLWLGNSDFIVHPAKNTGPVAAEKTARWMEGDAGGERDWGEEIVIGCG